MFDNCVGNGARNGAKSGTYYGVVMLRPAIQEELETVDKPRHDDKYNA